MWQKLGKGSTKYTLGGFFAALCLIPSVGPGTAQAQEEDIPESLLMGGDADNPLFQEDGRIWWVGWQFALSKDQLAGEQPINYDWGIGLNIPVTMELYKGLGARLALGITYSGDAPLDEAQIEISYQIPSEETGQPDSYITKTVGGFFGSVQLTPSFVYTHPLLEGSVNPYVGFGPAVMLAYSFSDIEAEDALLLDFPPGTEIDDDEIDPYSVNLTVGANAFFGVNFMLARSLHLNVEASYIQATMEEARLEKAKEGYNATRTAFVYSAMSVSTGLLWHF